jgi:hypothetical protein
MSSIIERCTCAACGRVFRSERSFMAHRRGKPDARRCATDEEIIRATQEFPGLVELGGDVWGFLSPRKEGSL